MSDKSQWWDVSWNPVTGCTPQSEGCAHCYAKRIHEKYFQAVKFEKVILHPERLDQPSRMKKGKVIFVDSMSDLFHEKVPFEFIGQVFDVMQKNPQHTFIVLTKRDGRMLEFFEWLWEKGQCGQKISVADNVWMGVTIENEGHKDRLVNLFKSPVRHRFVSIEPMLGPVDIYAWLVESPEDTSHLVGCAPWETIEWVICGGETGRGVARPMQIDWVRSLRDHCAEAQVPFFFKQWGEFRPANESEAGFGIGMISAGRNNSDRSVDGREWNEKPAELTPEPLRHGDSEEIYTCGHGMVIKKHDHMEVQLSLMGEDDGNG